jgi:hypothetical protein
VPSREVLPEEAIQNKERVVMLFPFMLLALVVLHGALFDETIVSKKKCTNSTDQSLKTQISAFAGQPVSKKTQSFSANRTRR